MSAHATPMLEVRDVPSSTCTLIRYKHLTNDLVPPLTHCPMLAAIDRAIDTYLRKSNSQNAFVYDRPVPIILSRTYSSKVLQYII